MPTERIKRTLARRSILRYLCSDADAIDASSQEGLISAFQDAAKRAPAYREILEERGVDFREVRNFEDFRRVVPVLNKEELFSRFDIRDLFTSASSLENIATAFTSSGFSGVYSCGIVSKKAATKQKVMIDALMDVFLDIGKRKTVLINALPMGVQFYSSHATVNTSVNTGMITSFLRLLGNKFDSVVIFSDPYFAKKIVEDCEEKGIDWKKAPASFVIGGQWCSNSFTNYLKERASISGETRILVTMGLSEIGLNTFNDSVRLGKIRDACQKDENLRKALFGDLKTVPEIMYCYPNKVFVETINHDKNGLGEIVLSTIGSDMPLIRYNSKDTGKLFGSRSFKEILEQHGYGSITPEFNLPIIGVYGRGDKFVYKGVDIMPQDVVELLFRDRQTAEKITGCFKIDRKKEVIDIQLRRHVAVDKDLTGRIQEQVKEFLGVDVPIEVCEYERFPHFMEVDYSSKFRFISENP